MYKMLRHVGKTGSLFRLTVAAYLQLQKRIWAVRKVPAIGETYEPGHSPWALRRIFFLLCEAGENCLIWVRQDFGGGVIRDEGNSLVFVKPFSSVFNSAQATLSIPTI